VSRAVRRVPDLAAGPAAIALPLGRLGRLEVHGAANQHRTVAYRDVARRPVVEPASRSASGTANAQVFLLECWPVR
jgi:hypothetical protein